MAIVIPDATSAPITYEQYLAEGEIDAKYDIVDGVRIFMPGPKWKHQVIVVNAIRILDRYRERIGSGHVIPTPFDVLIRRLPRLQTRQPDVLFISTARIEGAGGIPERGALEVAPELVVEIISESETEHSIEGKIADYMSIGVQECWLIRQNSRTVERLDPTASAPANVTTYDDTRALVSNALPGLTVPVREFFNA